MKLILDDGIEAQIHEIIPGNSVVIVSPLNKDDIPMVVKSLDCVMDIFSRYNITPIVAASDIKWMVIPNPVSSSNGSSSLTSLYEDRNETK